MLGEGVVHMPVQSTWAEREVPILEAIWHAEEAGGAPARTVDLAEATGLDARTAARTVAALKDAGYVSGQDVTSYGDTTLVYINLELGERGRRAIGQWPEGPAEAFALAINRLIAVEEDPQERTKLAKLRDAAADVGKQVLAGAVVAAAQAAAI